ncbi:lectin C-type domain protein [Aspergillus terreus]|uniref:Maintenance of telomere capping protein 6 n=1 Tax=Aspergillus terreus TaxID=33178 RepID=A0A5M3YLG3_ASPTE|nr:hypothetical protein ATETN484_0001035700 [Aspergillus terreus]GFF12213.1 lectin C-type domain protein [Aspergillus terreus]
MPLSYNPDGSLVDPTWAAVFLSERDVAGQIPINFVTSSAVSIRAACFGNGIFEDTAAERCISNLLAVGYRRFIVDLYWSVTSKTWTFCPVRIPANAAVETVTSALPSATPTATAGVSQGKVTEIVTDSGAHLVQLGPYLCSRNFDLSSLVDIWQDYFKSTTSQLNVYTRYISFNLHVAADPETPDEPASEVPNTDLPVGSERVGELIDDRLLAYIYTPAQLADERQNLNDSWYEVDDGYKPIAEYFTTIVAPDGTHSTPDGWPCTKYVQLAREKRLLLEYGTIDPQLHNYVPVPDDSEVLFPPGYLSSIVPVASADSGSLDSSCFYNPQATLVSQVNTSWAVSSRIPVPSRLNQSAGLADLSAMVVNLTACGLTPTLNDTIFNVTADADAAPYRNISLSSSWAWDIGEPHDSSITEDMDAPKRNRCAVMDLSLQGHWRSANCSEPRRAACRVGHLPFTWTLSDGLYDYGDAYANACPENSSMAVPRTGLENTYLYRHLLSQSADVIDPTSTDPALREVWLDFNSLDIPSCWVTGGPDAECSYASDPQQLEKRTVLVAAIAGIVICIIAALTLFVKCNANRRNSRRGKRVIQGWEYEGVPS